MFVNFSSVTKKTMSVKLNINLKCNNLNNKLKQLKY